jgi:hypothetical protein
LPTLLSSACPCPRHPPTSLSSTFRPLRPSGSSAVARGDHRFQPCNGSGAVQWLMLSSAGGGVEAQTDGVPANRQARLRQVPVKLLGESASSGGIGRRVLAELASEFRRNWQASQRQRRARELGARGLISISIYRNSSPFYTCIPWARARAEFV